MLFEYKENSLKSGVYQIRNLTNGKVYIGSAKRFKERGKDHLRSLERGKHSNKHLQSAFNKDGTNNFVFEVVEVVEGNKLARTTKEKFYLEQYLSDKWEECYNFQKNPLSNDRTCWSKTLEETRKKQSIALKKLWQDQEYRKKIPLFGFGKKNPNYGGLKMDTINKIKKARKNQKMKNGKPVIQFTKNGKFIRTFPSALAASRETQIFASNITYVCQGKRKTAGGYVWNYRE